MTKILSTIIALLLLSSNVSAATKTFGYGKTYDWSSTYWSTLTNVQDTNITTATASDGWKVLSYATATATKTWSDMDGWTEGNTGTGADSSIDNGQLKQDSGTGANSLTQMYKLDFGASDNTWGSANLVKFDVLSTSTADAQAGSMFRMYDGTRRHFFAVRSDGTYFDLYSHDGTHHNKIDTTVPADTTRYHLLGRYNNNAANGTVISMDGVELTTSARTIADATAAGRFDLFAQHPTGDPNNVGHHVVWTKFFDGIARWQTSDGVMESSPSAAPYDAGVGSRWSQIDWTAVTANSTALTVEYRVAGSAAALASASYATATSGAALASKDRFIQIKVTMSDASSGQYTPVLKDMTLTNETPAAASGGFHSLGGIRKIR